MKPPPGRPALNIGPVLAGVLVAVSLGALAYLAVVGWHTLFPMPQHAARMPTGCDLHAGPCSARFPDGSRVTLAISPTPPTPLQPMRLTVEVDGHEASDASVTLRGATMNMGEVTVPLLDIGHGMFAGDTSLPVCTRRSMAWVAEVVSDTSAGIYRAEFSFDMHNR